MDIGVLTIVTAGLAVFAVLAGARVLESRRVQYGRAGRVWTAGTFTTLALVAWFFGAGRHQPHKLALEAMRDRTENPHARADCQRLTRELFDRSQQDGYVSWDNSDVALYRRHICHDLPPYAEGGHTRPSEAQMQAVDLIAHESMRVAGLRSESETECHAVHVSHLVVRLLGAMPAQAPDLQACYQETAYPRVASGYTSPECREGGEFDIHL